MNMIRGEHTFEFEGVRYQMVLDANAFCEIEGVLGYDLPSLINSLNQNRPSIRVMRAVLFGALHRNHGLTLEGAGDLLQRMGLERTFDEVGTVAKASLPQKEEGDASGEAQPPVARSGRGRASSVRGAKPGKTRTASGGRHRA